MQVQSFAAPVSTLRQTVSVDMPLPAIVDQLADVQVAIAVLENLANNLKATLISSGLKEICGTQVRANVVQVKEGVTVEWKRLAESFSPSAAEIAAHSKKRDGYTKVELRGYN